LKSEWGLVCGKSGLAMKPIRYIMSSPAKIYCLPVVTGGGSATRPLPRNGGTEELHGDPIVGPRLKVWTRVNCLPVVWIGQRWGWGGLNFAF